MKVKEIRELSTEDINAKLKETKEELFNLRFQQATGNLEKPSRIRDLRHTVARLKTVLKCNRNCFLLYKESTERSILFLLTKWFCCNKIVIKCGCVHSGLLLSGDNKQLRGKQIGDDHDRKKENNSGGCGEADRYLP